MFNDFYDVFWISFIFHLFFLYLIRLIYMWFLRKIEIVTVIGMCYFRWISMLIDCNAIFVLLFNLFNQYTIPFFHSDPESLWSIQCAIETDFPILVYRNWQSSHFGSNSLFIWVCVHFTQSHLVSLMQYYPVELHLY